jgi:hypothetical protein
LVYQIRRDGMDATVILSFEKAGLPLPTIKTWEGVDAWIQHASDAELKQFCGVAPTCDQFAAAREDALAELARREECVLAMVKRALTPDPRGALVHDLMRVIALESAK